MRVLSLFDGISIGRLALNNLGIAVSEYHAFEIDQRAIAVSNLNFTDITQHGDVTKIDYSQFRGIDLLIGGSPCQDLSQFNTERLGLAGSKSGLFYYYAEALRRCKPKYFFFENVGNLNKADEDILNGIFGSTPQVICSSVVSAQTRKRNYWTNLGTAQIVPKVVKAQEILLDGIAPRDTFSAVLTHGASANEEAHVRKIAQAWPSQLVFVPDGKGLYVHGEVPYGDRYYKNLVTGIRYRTRRPYAIELERLQTMPDDYTKYGIYRGQPKEMGYHARHSMIGNSWTVKIIEAFFSNIR